MPNQRAKGQEVVAFALKAELLQALDLGRGGESRSQFIRLAIVRECQRRGIEVLEMDAAAPDRAGRRREG